MANRWGNSRTVADFILGGLQNHCRWRLQPEIKRCLLLGRKAMKNLDSILKSRDSIDKDPSSQSYGFSSSHVWMWELDVKKAEWQRIDAFELWCWRRLLRVPWTSRRSNHSFLKEISPEYSLEGLMLKLKLHTLATWCEERTHWKRPWCWERLKAGEEGDDRGFGGWMASLTRWTWVWESSGSWWWTGKPGVLQSMGSQRVRHDWATELIIGWLLAYLKGEINNIP